MPEGSSSAAPVIRPGPSSLKNRRTGRELMCSLRELIGDRKALLIFICSQRRRAFSRLALMLAAVGDESLEHFNLLLLHANEVSPIRIAQLVELFVKLHDFHFGLQVDFIIVPCLHPIFVGLSILTHHNYRRGVSGLKREAEIEEDEGIR